MKTKTSIALAVTIAASILLVGISFAYFSANLTGGEETTTITVTGGTMNIVYNGGATINIDNLIPSDAPTTTKTFTVTGNNTTDVEMLYQVSLVIDENTFSEEALKYKLISTNTNNNGTIIPSINELTSIGTGSKTIDLGVGEFTSPTGGDKVHTYKLELYFPNTAYNQNIDQDKMVKAHVNIKNYAGTNLLTLNNYIMNLESDSLNTDLYNENGYRYQGTTPNNYVLFNNELWRIIGVFGDQLHGKIGQNLVKIIKADILGEHQWDTNNTNNWAASSLKEYLNDTYYNQITVTSKNMIDEITWKLGGKAADNYTASDFYTSEQGTTVYEGNAITWTGMIGLLFSSDIGYASIASSCSRTTALTSYDSEECRNWLSKSVDEYTMTTSVHNNYDIWSISSSGSLTTYDASEGFSVRPALYLKSNILRLDGDGTLGNPYTLGQ